MPRRFFGRNASCRGQASVLLLALLVALVAMVFWLLDTHTAVMARLRAQDTGDAATLAAARWQAAGLNLCGELNLIHAYMLADDVINAEDAAALYELQQRVALMTPLLAFRAAQTVAQKNGADPQDEVYDFLKQWVEWVDFSDRWYEGATEDFREALRVLLREKTFYAAPMCGVALSATSLLGNQDFYEAILADDYCWFWFYAYRFLQTYRSHTDFGAVPQVTTSFFYDLDPSAIETSLQWLLTEFLADGKMKVLINHQLRSLGHPELPELPKEGESYNAAAYERFLNQNFMGYGSTWKMWTKMHDGMEDSLPLRAEVKPEYDVMGAFVGVSIKRNGYAWSACAKPFGTIGEGDLLRSPCGGGGIMLGGFDAVRLIPLDSVDVDMRPFDAAWYGHLYFHIREYAKSGITFSDCRYCSALNKWDNSTFRSAATAWLRLYGTTCRRPKISGHGDTGGSHYAH